MSVTAPMSMRQRNMPIPRLMRRGSASDVFPVERSMRNMLHPNAHGVIPVRTARNI